MSERQDHPSHLFPKHGEVIAVQHVRPDGTVEATPPDFDQRVAADRTAVWRKFERPLEGASVLVRGPGDADWRPLMECIVEFEPATDCDHEAALPEQFYCPVCGIDFEYRAAPREAPSS